jgi:hypothetical protein
MMGGLIDKVRDEPALSAAILSLLGAVLGFFVKNPALIASLVGVAAVFIGVRQVVVPVSTAATQMTQAATQSATEVVKSLDSTVVGTVGEITAPAQQIVQSTVHEVVAALGGK